VDPGTSRSRTSIRKVRSVLSRTGALSTTRGLVRRNLWIAPVLAIVALVFAATWVRARIETAIKDQKQSELETLLKADVEALRLWMRLQEDNATVMVHDDEIRQSVIDLAAYAAAGNTTSGQMLQAPARRTLGEELQTWLDAPGYLGFVVFNPQGLILDAEPEVLIGQNTILGQGMDEYIHRVLAGRVSVSRPISSRVMMPDESGGMSVGVPVMFVAAPVRNDDEQVVAVVALRISPSQDFTKILNVARPGASGETYAFNAAGVLLSSSRFENELKEIALLPDQPSARSVLSLELRDPGVDLRSGARAALPRSEQPMTQMVADAVKHKPTLESPGVNVEGYRDYRGVEVIGVWTWLPDYGFGVATEMDRDEAFAPLFILHGVFWTLFGLLALVAALLLGLTLLARRLESRMRDAVIEAGQLGQYALEEKIGEGGMGSVYRARHAMLRRPTAVKLLEPAKTTEVSVARFEREVQLTSQLNHPNTITIYDYGRTGEGIFYYAMEFLDGFSLDVLVQRFGPQPDGRVIQILLQVCGSLVEAHTAGLIHRDIKPANIMLTRRGGVCDFVKLLDFGLVKAVDSEKMRTLTAADAITGTPLYIAPETVLDSNGTDARSDLYSLGAVGYFLLTGRPVFDTGGVMEIMKAHVDKKPIAPSKRLARPMSRELEQLILMCLEKMPQDRPQSAAEMAERLAGCSAAQPWSAADAESWWRQYQPTVAAGPPSEVTEDVRLASTMGYSEAERRGKPGA
jgi:eukaryotic-like serine/threonine-protein kinase